jgi:serine/threonine protein kinase/Ca2+-binding EF-hand superfamily protein
MPERRSYSAPPITAVPSVGPKRDELVSPSQDCWSGRNASSSNASLRWNALHEAELEVSARTGLACCQDLGEDNNVLLASPLPNVRRNNVLSGYGSSAIHSPSAVPEIHAESLGASSASSPLPSAGLNSRPGIPACPSVKCEFPDTPPTHAESSDGFPCLSPVQDGSLGTSVASLPNLQLLQPSSPEERRNSTSCSGLFDHKQQSSGSGLPPTPSPGNGPFDIIEVRALREKFNELDRAGSGAISKDAFHNLFTSLVGFPEAIGEEARGELLDFVYQLFNGSGGSRLNLREFIAGCIVLGRGSEDDRLRYLFQMYDIDRSGSLSLTELERMFHVIHTCATVRGVATGVASLPSAGNVEHSVTNISELAARAMREHDLDRDGKIGLNDFAQWCSAEPYVREWMDWLSVDTARGMTRLREEREREMILKELSNLGFGDNEFWRESFSLVNAAASSSNILQALPGCASDSYPPMEGHAQNQSTERFFYDPSNQTPSRVLRSAPPSSVTHSSQTTLDDEELPHKATSIQSNSTAREVDDGDVQVLRSASTSGGRANPFEIDFESLQLISRIGEGSYAVVWKGKWLDTDVAVKVLKAGPQMPQAGAASSGSGAHAPAEGSRGDRNLPLSDSLDETLEPELASTFDRTAKDPDGSAAGREINGQPSISARDRIHFLREVGLLTSLRHPNVLLLMGACTDPRYPLCIVSELVEGGSLYSYLHGRNGHRLSHKHALKLALDIARGMLYLHSSTPIVLHRDLKSSNILVEGMEEEESPKAKIIDFGLSRLDSATDSRLGGVGRGLCGSLMTMAPEVMRGEMYLPASDVYSFGVILNEMFSGRVPFEESNAVQLMYGVSVQGKRPKMLESDEIPKPIVDLITACWDQDPSMRPDFSNVVKRLNDAQRLLIKSNDAKSSLTATP